MAADELAAGASRTHAANSFYGRTVSIERREGDASGRQFMMHDQNRMKKRD
jgi:hypothetical protein